MQTVVVRSVLASPQAGDKYQPCLSANYSWRVQRGRCTYYNSVPATYLCYTYDKKNKTKISNMRHDPLKFVNRRKYIHITGTRIPHWNQNDCVQFVTFRLADSLPQSKLQEYRLKREQWLNTHPKPWDASVQEDYDNSFGAVIDRWIDAGYGACILKDKRVRDVLTDIMMHSDGIKYEIYAFVIMPNHVHVLMTPTDGNMVQGIVGAWKSASSHAINTLLGRRGIVWEHESFDHLVRNSDEFKGCLQYIADNPHGLPPDWYTLENMM